MNANTALKIDDAIDQAVRCGESIAEIEAQVGRALLQARRSVALDRLEEAKAALLALDVQVARVHMIGR